MIYLIFFIGFMNGLLLGLFLRALYTKKRRSFHLENYYNEYKSFLEFDGSYKNSQEEKWKSKKKLKLPKP